MSKLKAKLRSFLRSDKGKRVFAFFALVCVLSSLFSISSSAANEFVIKAGLYYSFKDPVIPSKSLVQDISFSSFGSDDFESFDIRVGHNSGHPNTLFLHYVDSDNDDYIQAGSNEGRPDGSTIWHNDDYRLIYIHYDTVVSSEFYSWFINQYSDGSGYYDGYSQGFSDGQILGYDSGYNDGYSDGRSSTDSENLGQNLLGDTLSAPLRALNQFTLYESTSGFKVTLGLVVGGAISLTLFIAFLKIFTGG